MRLGGHAKEGQLLRGAIQTPARQAWTEESHLRRRGLYAHCDLPYAEGWNAPSGPRRRSLRPTLERGQSQAPRRATGQARLPRRTTARGAGSLNALSKCRSANTHKATNQPPQIAVTRDQPSKATEFLPRDKWKSCMRGLPAWTSTRR